MNANGNDSGLGPVTWLALVIAGAIGVSTAAQAVTVYDYVGNDWVYSQPLAPGYQIYGTHVVGTLSIDDSLLTPGFSGTLNGSQFTALLGTDSPSFPLQAAGDWSPPPQNGPPLFPAFVTFSNGQIVDWSLGTVQSVVGNTFTFGTTRTGDVVYPFPRVVFFGTANAPGPGTWTLATPSAVPLPAAGYLLLAGLAGLGAVARRRVDRRATWRSSGLERPPSRIDEPVFCAFSTQTHARAAAATSLRTCDR